MEIATHSDAPALGRPFAAAVVITTLLRPTLLEAVRSVYAQDIAGPVHLLLGIDVRRGPADLLDQVLAERPAGSAVTVCDPGYSTCARNGGLCLSYSGGELRTVLTYLAHSRHVAYLDDDNWWAPDHLSSLRAAIEGAGWAYALRWFVDAASGERLLLDRWRTEAHDPTLPSALRHGYADTNATMIDKLRCHGGIAEWSHPDVPSGEAADRVLWRWLRAHQPGRGTGRGTVLYRMEDRHQLGERMARRRAIDPPRRRPLAALLDVVHGPAPASVAAAPVERPPLAGAREVLIVGDAADPIDVARAAPDAAIVVLDSWRAAPEDGADPPAAYAAFRSAVTRAGLQGRVRPLPMRPLAGLRFLQRVGCAVDLAFLDLDRAGADADAATWLDAAAVAVRPGGAMRVRAASTEACAALDAFARAWAIDVAAADAHGLRRLALPAI